MDPAPAPAPEPAPERKRPRFTLPQEAPDQPEPPVPSLFRASSAAAPPVPVPVPVPVLPGPGSYAEFVMRGSGGTGKAPTGAGRRHRDRDWDQNRDRDREQNRDREENRDRDRDQNRDREQNRDQDRDREQTREVRALPVIKPGTKSSSIIVSPRQRGNPVLKFIRSVPWEFGEIVPDYVLGQSSCALFLRYHQLHPGYIHERLRALGRSFGLQVLLLQVDVRDPGRSLQDLAKVCLLSDCTLLLAWSPEECGRYLETFKSFEQKPPDLLRERLEQDFLSRVSECLSGVRSVTRTDALSLLGTFGSLAALAGASREDLSLCPGVGPQKAKRLFEVLHQPFLK